MPDEQTPAQIDLEMRSARRRQFQSGRHTKLTPELVERIFDMLQTGAKPKTVAIASGIALATYQGWMRQGRTDLANGLITPHAILVEVVEEGESRAEMMYAAIVMNAAARPDGWKAAIEMLKRRWPDRWSEHKRHEHTGPDGEQLVIELSIAQGPRAEKDEMGNARGFQMLREAHDSPALLSQDLPAPVTEADVVFADAPPKKKRRRRRRRIRRDDERDDRG